MHGFRPMSSNSPHPLSSHEEAAFLGSSSVLHMSHQSLTKGSQVFPTGPNEAQQPLIVPNRPCWVALAPLPWALMGYMSSRGLILTLAPRVHIFGKVTRKASEKPDSDMS